MFVIFFLQMYYNVSSQIRYDKYDKYEHYDENQNRNSQYSYLELKYTLSNDDESE